MLAASLGCGSKFDSLCEAHRECLDGNDRDHDACVARLEGRESAAAELGCDSEFSAYFECRERESACEAGYFADLDLRCQPQADALAACADINFLDLRF